MLGGGTFLTQNKVLPGTYINFVSAIRASASLADRGIAALPVAFDWGVEDAVFMVTTEDLQKDSLKIFGYDYTADALKGVRDLFKNIHTCYFYKLMNAGVAASNTYCTAKYKGVRGNDLKTVVVVNADDGSKMDVSTYLGTVEVDKQTVLPNTDNLADNDFVVWKTNVVINVTAGLSLTLGSNGDALTGTQHQAALDALEAYSFNTIGCLSTDDTTKGLYAAFTERMRDQVGVKFQCVVHQYTTPDYEGVISVENNLVTGGSDDASLVYWVTGAAAGCAVNSSNTNKKYDGEFTVDTVYKQSELEAAIEAGKFMFHKVGEDIRVLDDINTFTSFTPEKNVDFSSNQVIRVLDQVANDIGVLFNTRYLGKVPNDASGRISLWNDIVKHHQELQRIRAIQEFVADDVQVSAGENKDSVVVADAIIPTCAMTKLYMTVTVE